MNRNATIRVNLRRYFPVLREMEFTSEHINEEKNVIMLDHNVHVEFGKFNLIFESTGMPHQYRVKTFPGIMGSTLKLLPRNPQYVRLRVHKGNWDLPDPKLLNIHAAIGTFLHMSGEAELINKLLRDFDECGGFAPSGRTNVEGLLSVSKLALLASNVGETSDPQTPTEKQHPTVKGLSLVSTNVHESSQQTTDKPRPTAEQHRPLGGRSTDTENKPWGY